MRIWLILKIADRDIFFKLIVKGNLIVRIPNHFFLLFWSIGLSSFNGVFVFRKVYLLLNRVVHEINILL